MKSEQKNKMKKNKTKSKWYFLLIVVLLVLPLYFIFPAKGPLILKTFLKLLLQILPIFLIVYLIMVLMNYFIDNKKIKKLISEETGLKAWLISIVAGIASSGPIYAWYPLLSDLQKRGIKNRFLASFLYNRGIKLQWTPILISYFGWKYSLVLLLVMAILSVPQGIITEKLINYKTV